MNQWSQLIVSNLVVACLIGSVAWFVGRSGRRATIAHLLWLTFFVKLITPPIITVPITIPSDWAPAVVASVTPASLARSNRGGGRALDNPLSLDRTPAVETDRRGDVGALLTSRVAFDFRKWFLTVWLIGFVTIAVHGLVRFVRFHRLVRMEGVFDPTASSFVQSLVGRRADCGSTKCVGSASPRVLLLPMRVSPMLFGFGRRPLIVCPEPLWRSLSEPEQHVLLAHETAHFCRRDHWIRWLEWLVTAVYWWFPGVYVARRQLERHEEACCDAWAVRRLAVAPRQYGESLLRVVDFICDHEVGIPRIASGMQPTESLAERLRLLMRPNPVDDSSVWIKATGGAVAVVLCLIHPLLQPQSATANSASQARIEAAALIPSSLQAAAIATSVRNADEVVLPEMPRGYWNRPPQSLWANQSLALAGARLTADTAQGLRIEVPQREALVFDAHEVSAIVDMPSTQRVVIGDREGRVRLWDLSAGVPVSLIGKHQSEVTSLAYGDSVGIFSADATGAVIRWDLQSGTPLASWTSNSMPVQSIRLSLDGHFLALVLGRWNESINRSLQFVDSKTLEQKRSLLVSHTIAIVLELPKHGWVTVDWWGQVRCLQNDRLIAAIPKHSVSALLLSQNALLDVDHSTQLSRESKP